MTPGFETTDAARLLGRILARTGARRLMAGDARCQPVAGLRAQIRNRAFAPLANRLARAAAPEHRAVAAALAAAIDAADDAAALALVSTAGRRPDLRAEKILSHRHRYLWICNPKVASRSIVAALRATDPGARLIRRKTLDQVLAAHPRTRGYFRFAFLRHPVDRTRSFWADKHTLALTNRDAHRWFIAPYFGVSADMDFEAFCRWLDTPFGSDAFADRHWLSQHRQLRDGDGRLPDFLGRYERLDADWRTVCQWTGLPLRALPRLNARPEGSAEAPVGAATAALLRRRYAEDFTVGGYGDAEAEHGSGA